MWILPMEVQGIRFRDVGIQRFQQLFEEFMTSILTIFLYVDTIILFLWTRLSTGTIITYLRLLNGFQIALIFYDYDQSLYWSSQLETFRLFLRVLTRVSSNKKHLSLNNFFFYIKYEILFKLSVTPKIHINFFLCQLSFNY